MSMERRDRITIDSLQRPTCETNEHPTRLVSQKYRDRITDHQRTASQTKHLPRYYSEISEQLRAGLNSTGYMNDGAPVRPDGAPTPAQEIEASRFRTITGYTKVIQVAV